MNIDEIRKLDKGSIEQEITRLRSALQQARFSVSQRQLKNVRSIRAMKKTIARMMTVLKSMNS